MVKEAEQNQNLYDRVKKIQILHSHESSKTPEIIEIIQKVESVRATAKQIEKVLRAVPNVFPENWQVPAQKADLTKEQSKLFKELNQGSHFKVSLRRIQKIISTARVVRSLAKLQPGIKLEKRSSD